MVFEVTQMRTDKKRMHTDFREITLILCLGGKAVFTIARQPQQVVFLRLL